MSIEYAKYLKEHIGNVNKAYEWLCKHLYEEIADVPWSPGHGIGLHDESKYTLAEYKAYDDYFYGGNLPYAVVEAFNYAWLHHIHNNTHH